MEEKNYPSYRIFLYLSIAFNNYPNINIFLRLCKFYF